MTLLQGKKKLKCSEYLMYLRWWFTLFTWSANHLIIFQSLSHFWLFETPWTAANQASLSITNSQNLLKLMSIESVMPSNHLILCCPLLLLPSILSSSRVFSNELVLHMRKPSTEATVSASVLQMNIQHWFPLVWLVWSLYSPRDSQESSPLHSAKSSFLLSSGFFMIQLSHSYMTTGKTIALTT